MHGFAVQHFLQVITWVPDDGKNVLAILSRHFRDLRRFLGIKFRCCNSKRNIVIARGFGVFNPNSAPLLYQLNLRPTSISV